MTRSLFRLGAFVFLLVSVVSCVSDDSPELKNFSGVQLFDENGNPLGCYGDCGDDWGNIPLSNDELDYLDFTDFLVVPDSTGPFNPSAPRVLPVPMATSGELLMLLGSERPTKFKMAIVSQDGEVRAFVATIIRSTNSGLALDNAFFADVPRGEVVRMYYAYFDTMDNPIYTGYGDLGICPFDPPIIDVSPCFE